MGVGKHHKDTVLEGQLDNRSPAYPYPLQYLCECKQPERQ